ncbi:MAG: hypothetical protein KME17_20770 [Cyanosarcina radialis HA8281-LM2]|nr:hypothetical protein [Cyanosarcina radialis HA8281-LM2]
MPDEVIPNPVLIPPIADLTPSPSPTSPYLLLRGEGKGSFFLLERGVEAISSTTPYQQRVQAIGDRSSDSSKI